MFKNVSYKTQRKLIITLFLLIPLTLLFVFTYLPAINMIAYSFTDWKGYGAKNFVGMQNYINIFSDPEIFSVLKNSLYYFVGGLIQLGLSFVFAVILNSKIKGKGFFKSLFFFPYLINGVAISLMFLFFFQPSGTLDTVLSMLGLDGMIRQWLGDAHYVNFSLAFTSIWRFFGYNFIIFLGALQSISDEVLEAADGEEALDIFYKDKAIALLILDVMMPKMNGWEVCREIRQTSKVPIIMLTAKSDESDELMGFDLGVDEYITKPFSPKILVARVEAILRRTNKIGDAADFKTAGEIILDKTAHEVKISGNPVELSFKEFELLEYFMNNQGIALSRERILNSVWNYDYFGDARTIDTHVKKLRNKLGACGSYIKTVWGMGYKFEVS